MESKHKAFTLAEVLITLGIIGVVAALTIPTLINANQKSVVETRLLKFYSTMNQAIKLSEIDNGDKKGWDAVPATSTDILTWYNKYLNDYLRTVKIDSTTSTLSIFIYFPDGSVITIGNASWTFFPEARTLNKLISANNLAGLKPTTGKDNFTFFFAPNNSATDYTYHYNKGVEPYKVFWDGTESKLKTDASLGCKQAMPTTQRAYCTALIQANSWKIPDDYPFFN